VSSDATTGTERTLIEQDADLDGSMVLGELDSDGVHHEDTDDESTKEGENAIKTDVDEPVKSKYGWYLIVFYCRTEKDERPNSCPRIISLTLTDGFATQKGQIMFKFTVQVIKSIMIGAWTKPSKCPSI
jgi:hypothetical protein